MVLLLVSGLLAGIEFSETKYNAPVDPSHYQVLEPLFTKVVHVVSARVSCPTPPSLRQVHPAEEFLFYQSQNVQTTISF